MRQVMERGLWISRHQPTAEQMEGLLVTKEGLALGARNINTREEYREYVLELTRIILEYRPDALAGVFPAPIMEYFWINRWNETRCFPVTIPVYVAWNINRAPDGEKPTFEFNGWCYVGEYTI